MTDRLAPHTAYCLRFLPPEGRFSETVWNLGDRNRLEGSYCREVTVRDKVEKVMTIIRPAMQADGGDIVLRDVDEETGVVSVELLGACGDCPMAEMDLKLGVERILIDRVPGVTEVINIGVTPEPTETTWELKGLGL